MESLKGRDFLRVADWSAEELLAVLDLADRLKDERKRYVDEPLLPGRSVGLFLEKPSLRTRVSFELAVEQLGAHAVYLTGPEIGLGSREAPRDVAYVLSRYLDAIVIRTFAQAIVEEIAEHAYIPVVNGLTDDTHPCQALADAMTIRERLGRFDGVRVAWLGDGNNVCASLMAICAKLGMDFVAATPPGYEPSSIAIEAARSAGGSPSLVEDPREAARGRGRALHRRVDQHGPGGRARAPATRPRSTPHRRGRRRCRRAGRDRPSLPARPHRRGDHRGRSLRSPLCRLGRGREPAAHREGPARPDRALMGGFEEHVRAALDSLPPELARGLENVAVVVEERNPEEPDLYGLFDEPEYLPARISIYRRPLLEDFGDDPAAARARDPGHRPPRARPLLRPRRGPSGRAGIRVNTALEAIAIASAVVGAAVIVLFFVGPWR